MYTGTKWIADTTSPEHPGPVKCVISPQNARACMAMWPHGILAI